MRSHLLARSIAGAALLLATLSACAAPDDGAPSPAPLPRDSGLRAAVAFDGEAFAAHESLVAAVSITNSGTRPEQLLAWYVGDDELAAPILAVWRDGVPVAYRGPLVKRRAPQPDDFVTLAPGATVTRRIDLAAAYDLSRSGDYTLRVQISSAAVRGSVVADARYVLSTDRSFWAEGRAAARPPEPTIGAAKPAASCSPTELATLADAVGVATTMSSGAASYLAGSPAATQRYLTWFGAFSPAGWNTAAGHFGAIADAFATKPVTFDCKCKQRNVYAFVNPNQPYLISLCGAFWPAPLGGTDSKGGTLVHEMSHFNVTAATDDWAYGQTACRSLALTDPAHALDNADRHEYFAENTPALP